MTEQGRSKRKTYRTAGIILAAAVLAFAIIFVGINRVSLDKIPDYISSGEYEKVVTAYNKYAAGDSAKEKEYNEVIDKAITDIVIAWSGDEISEEDATGALEILSDIDNKSLSDAATKNRDFIALESESDRLYEQAEESFKNAEYLEALKSLVKIDQSYSQYECVEDFVGECKEILIAEVSYPTSIREYEEYHARVKEYLRVVEAPEFVEKEKQMTEEYRAFVTAAPVLEKAKKAFDNEEYASAFETLDAAKGEHPDNRFITEELDELHNLFVVSQAQLVSAAVQQEDYDKAIEITKAAIEVYDCEELESVKKYVYEEKYPVYKFGNNVVAKITTLFNRWTSEDFDVHQAGNNAGAYIVRSGKKMALGDYDESEVTLLSVSGEIATSLVGVDMALDVRDLSYDVTHWGEGDYFALRVATDAVALVPVVGAIKYLKYSKEASKGAKAGVKTAKAVIGGTSLAAKRTNKILNMSTDIGKNSDESVSIAKVLFKRYEKYPTKCQNFVGGNFPGTDIPIRMKKVKYSDGRKIKGAFPVFNSKKDLQLPPELYKSNEKTQIRWLNSRLLNLSKEGKLGDLFSEQELKAIEENLDKAPAGYVWHHNEEEGLMQLVVEAEHKSVNPHTGGMSLWRKGYGKKIPDDISK